MAPVQLYDFTRPDDAADVLGRNVTEKTTATTYSRMRQRDAWRLSDDRVIGGYSESFAHLIRPSREEMQQEEEESQQQELPTRIQQDENDSDSNDQNNRDSELSEPSDDDMSTKQPAFRTKRPFLRWYGNLDTTVGLESNAQRSGFAALRSPTFHMGGANLRGAYTALEVTCRTDGRVYTINLQVTTSLPNDIFQGHIDVPATTTGKWDRLYLPFTEFGFLGPGARGFAPRKQASRIIGEEEADDHDDEDERHVTNQQRQEHFRRRRSARRHTLEIGAPEEEKTRLDDKIVIESVGFTLMDGQDGPFQFDLAQIRAVNFFEDEVWEGATKSKSLPFVRFRA